MKTFIYLSKEKVECRAQLKVKEKKAEDGTKAYLFNRKIRFSKHFLFIKSTLKNAIQVCIKTISQYMFSQSKYLHNHEKTKNIIF